MVEMRWISARWRYGRKTACLMEGVISFGIPYRSAYFTCDGAGILRKTQGKKDDRRGDSERRLSVE